MFDNDPDAIRAVIWHQTDASYKRALDQLTKVKTNVEVKVAQDDKSADFSREAPEHYSEPIVDVQVNRAAWEDKIRKYTAPFARYTNIYEASASFTAAAETRWYVNSEGAVIQTSRPAFRLFINANTKASDGMELPLYESYFGFTEKDLPDDATVRCLPIDTMSSKSKEKAEETKDALGNVGTNDVGSGVTKCKVKKHWIGIKVKDSDGKVCNTVPPTLDVDGSVAAVTLDKKGKYDSGKVLISAADANISFPDLFDCDWWPDGSAAPTERESTRLNSS